MIKKVIRVCFVILLATAVLPYIVHASPGDALEKAIYWHGDKSEKKVALTFDDGPNEPYTSEILDILKKRKAKATFFQLGKFVEDYPDVSKRVVEEGHAIGNHTYSHPDLRFESLRVIQNQLVDCEEAIFKATGIRPSIFRPPYGAKSPKIIKEAKKLGLVIIEYSVSSKGGGKTRLIPEYLVKNVLSKVKNGSIILMHDGDRYSQGMDRSATVKAVGIIVESLQKEGYELVTVPELLKLK